jgi:peptidoglycan/LPS O-acetylase OafA/YrhL
VVEECYVIGSVDGNPVAGRRRRQVSGLFWGLAVITGVIALADPSSHSSYILVQHLNPYFTGALSIASAATAGAFSSGRRSERWAAGILGCCVALGLVIAGLLSAPPAPKYSLNGPGNGLVLLVTSDASFRKSSDVVTIQKPSGIAGQEWTANEARSFFVDPQTGVPLSTGMCHPEPSSHRPGVRSPR